MPASFSDAGNQRPIFNTPLRRALMSRSESLAPDPASKQVLFQASRKKQAAKRRALLTLATDDRP